MRSIDYDTEQYQDYARGRALTEQQLQASIGAFGALLPERRPPGDRRRAVGPPARNSAGAVFQPLHEVIATDELEAGFRRLEQAVGADPGARRLQILRPCSCSNGARRLLSKSLVKVPRCG